MGTQIAPLISAEEISLQKLSGKILAVDAFNWLYQFLSIIRGVDGEPLKDSKGRITSHLSGVFYRGVNLLEAGIKLIYVFDGKPPEFKAEEQERRRRSKQEAALEFEKAKEAGDLKAMRKYAMRTVHLDEEMIEGAKELLLAMGIAVVQAPSEGEALCSQMVKNKDAWAIATQDYDALLFGSPRIVRNLSISGRRKYGKGDFVLVNPELLELQKVLKELDINIEQLRVIGLLVGTDYNPKGIRGIGPKKALDLVKKKKIDEIFREVEWSFEYSAEDIMDFFRNPPEGKYKIEFPGLDAGKIRKILCDRHEFSEERVNNALKRLKEKESGGLKRFA
ncbi:MAG: flap endonuclease-1 [Candidatus Aenigmarchaeota archaeon]|nr:flap endonuclease-1 [Candidatus Aenigmarchaeota archaeon]